MNEPFIYEEEEEEEEVTPPAGDPPAGDPPAKKDDTPPTTGVDLEKELAQVRKERDEAMAKLTESERVRAEQSDNFRKLKDLTKEEKAKLSATEIELMKRQEALEEKEAKFVESQRQTYIDDALDRIAGDDAKLKEKIMINYKRISGEANTKKEIEERTVEAYNMLGLNQKNPLAAAVNASGDAPKGGETSDTRTKELAEGLGLPIKLDK